MIKLTTIYRFLTGEAFCLYGGGKGSTPPAPDYRGAAQEQAAAGREAQAGAIWANRPTINTPWGQQTWGATAGVDPSTGAPITEWTSNINLTPEQQKALESQQRIQEGRSGAAETLLGQATKGFETPFDWGGLPAAPGSIADAQKGAYETMSQMLQPGRQQQQSALDARLANMGLPMGTEAYKRASGQLGEQFAAQDKQMMAQALGEGRADVGSQQALRQGAIAEQAQRRGMTLNELNALLTGQQVQSPQMPGVPQAQPAAPPNLLGAAQAQGQYGLGAAQAGGGGPDYGSMIGSVASVAAIAL